MTTTFLFRGKEMKKNEHITLTVDQFEYLFNTIDRMMTGKGIMLMYYSLMDTQGFGHNRIFKLHDKAMEYVEALNDKSKDDDIADLIAHLEGRKIPANHLEELLIQWSKKLQPFRFFREEWMMKHERDRGLIKTKITTTRNELERLCTSTEKFTTERAHILVCYALNKDFGIGAERMAGINKKYNKNLQFVAEGTIKMYDVENVLKHECKVVFDDDIPGFNKYWLDKLKPLRRMQVEWRGDESQWE